MGEGLTTWRVVLVASGGASLLPDQRLQLNGLPHADGPVDVVLFTRFEDVGLAERLPRELILEAHVTARDAEHATAVARAVGIQLVPLLAFVANAYVGLPVPCLAFEDGPGLTLRRYWQSDVEGSQNFLRPSRVMRDSLLFPVIEGVYGAGQRFDRLARAIGQYHLALAYWTVQGQPLALVHLYMALEALGPLAEKAARERLSLGDQEAHARHRGVVIKGNWIDVLLGWVRRDEICRGDKATYDAAKDATKDFRHGSGGLAAAFRASGGAETSRRMLTYVRRGVLDLLGLRDEVKSDLTDKSPLDLTPVQFEISGELTGDVADPDRLGEAESLYPYLEWRTGLDSAERLDDGSLRLFPRLDLTARLAESVQFTQTEYCAQFGANDPVHVNFRWNEDEDDNAPDEDKANPTGL